jgi:hypothetical protein
MLSLVGRFKQEDEERHFFWSLAVVMGSDLRIIDWIILILELKVRSGQTQGFLFQRKNGSQAKLAYFLSR